jgi:hypothetical protein
MKVKPDVKKESILKLLSNLDFDVTNFSQKVDDFPISANILKKIKK